VQLGLFEQYFDQLSRFRTRRRSRTVSRRRRPCRLIRALPVREREREEEEDKKEEEKEEEEEENREREGGREGEGHVIARSRRGKRDR
jgi:hypothetical protein